MSDDTNNETDDQARDFVRQLFDRSNRVQIDDQGITPESLNTLFSNND